MWNRLAVSSADATIITDAKIVLDSTNLGESYAKTNFLKADFRVIGGLVGLYVIACLRHLRHQSRRVPSRGARFRNITRVHRRPIQKNTGQESCKYDGGPEHGFARTRV